MTDEPQIHEWQDGDYHNEVVEGHGGHHVWRFYPFDMPGDPEERYDCVPLCDELLLLARAPENSVPPLHEERPGYVLCCCGDHLVPQAGGERRTRARRLSVATIRQFETEYERQRRLHPIRMRWESFKLAVSEWWHS